MFFWGIFLLELEKATVLWFFIHRYPEIFFKQNFVQK